MSTSPGTASKLVSSVFALPRTAAESWRRSQRRLVWPPDDGNPIGFRGCEHPLEDRGGSLGAVGPDGIDDRGRPAAHGGDVRQVDHDRAPAGEPRIGGHEFVDEAFDGKEEIAVAVRDRRAIVADRTSSRRRAGEGLRRERDVALRGEAAAFAQSAPRRRRIASSRPSRGLLGQGEKARLDLRERRIVGRDPPPSCGAAFRRRSNSPRERQCSAWNISAFWLCTLARKRRQPRACADETARRMRPAPIEPTRL